MFKQRTVNFWLSRSWFPCVLPVSFIGNWKNTTIINKNGFDFYFDNDSLFHYFIAVHFLHLTIEWLAWLKRKWKCGPKTIINYPKAFFQVWWIYSVWNCQHDHKRRQNYPYNLSTCLRVEYLSNSKWMYGAIAEARKLSDFIVSK